VNDPLRDRCSLLLDRPPRPGADLAFSAIARTRQLARSARYRGGCIVRSLVGGVSCFVALWAFLAASDADAFEAKRTSGGLPVHWEAANVTFEIDPSVAQAVAGGFDAVAEALGAWSGQSGAPTLTVTVADGKARPGNDGHNVIFFAAGGYAEAGNALAITVLSYDEITGAIVDADIIINGNHSFAVVADASGLEEWWRTRRRRAQSGSRADARSCRRRSRRSRPSAHS